MHLSRTTWDNQNVLFVTKTSKTIKNLILNVIFLSKHDSFGKTYPAGNERKTAVAELIRKSQQSTSKFNNWLQSASNLTTASFVVSHEIMKSGKPFTDGEYIKK